MQTLLDMRNVDDYRKFLVIKSLPQRRFVGRMAYYPDEYASIVEGRKARASKSRDFVPPDFLFDYQKDIAAMAIRKRKYAVFAEPGYGKTLIDYCFARHVLAVTPKRKKVLIVCPLMVVHQMVDEWNKFFPGECPLDIVRAANLPAWTRGDGGRFGITNFESITDKVEQGNLAGLIISESSMLKSHYGKWATRLIEIGKGLEWKLCETGTPAPNDRIEYANHAVFLDQSPTVNAYLAKYFVNKGMTGEHWELKPHAEKWFYKDMSHWCIFLSNPATYGWKDNVNTLPTIHTHMHQIELTESQQAAAMREGGSLFAGASGGFVSRQRMAQIAKGQTKQGRIDTLKPEFIKGMVDSWPTESTIIWCKYNPEQEHLASIMPQAASISGDTPEEDRIRLIKAYQASEVKTLITKPKVAGFGLNLQVTSRMIFSTLQDSYEEYWQAVKRGNRVGSKHDLHVHIPFTEIEWPMIQNVMDKAGRINDDTRKQELTFKESRYECNA